MPPEAQTQVRPWQDQVRENPMAAMARMESYIQENNLPPDRAKAFRTRIAPVLIEGGTNPYMAMAYAQGFTQELTPQQQFSASIPTPLGHVQVSRGQGNAQPMVNPLLALASDHLRAQGTGESVQKYMQKQGILAQRMSHMANQASVFNQIKENMKLFNEFTKKGDIRPLGPAYAKDKKGKRVKNPKAREFRTSFAHGGEAYGVGSLEQRGAGGGLLSWIPAPGKDAPGGGTMLPLTMEDYMNMMGGGSVPAGGGGFDINRLDPEAQRAYRQAIQVLQEDPTNTDALSVLNYLRQQAGVQ